MAETSPQRAYRAACPGCGAPVLFRSAQSTHAVCGYCQSTVVRQGDVLQRVGKMAELFDDHSLLQLGASGKLGGMGFVLVGRLQYKSSSGTWTEWEAVQDDGQTASLSEDNGAYIYSRPRIVARQVPDAEHLHLGATNAIDDRAFTVTAKDEVQLLSAQGELPHMPPLGTPFPMVELRSQGDADKGDQPGVLTLDYGPTLVGQPVAVSIGTSVLLEDLGMVGMKVDTAKEEEGRQFNCPHCGAPVTVALATSKSITCGSCNCLIDLSAGVGAELKSAIQDEPINPLIALGTLGQMQGVQWQVVGFQHRMGVEPGDDEHFGWSEYLLYNQKRGFAFLVDSEEGWSMVRPTTGAPQMARPSANKASYLGTDYTLKYSYTAETNYVCGEFYWPVHRDQTTQNRDFANGKRLLSSEQSGTELVWSCGEQVASDTVATAFGLKDKKDLFQRTDVAPFSRAAHVGLGTIIVIIILLVLLSVLLSRCSSCDPRVENCSSSSRSSGGSFGGYSGGGGHK